MDAKAFAEKIEQVNQRVAQLMEQAGGLPKRHRQLLDTAFGELDSALDELQAAEQELYKQQARLEASNQSLHAERLRYQNLFQLVPDAYIVTDLDGNILEANTTAGMLFGVGQATLTDLPLLQFCVVQDAPIFIQALRQLQEYDRFDEQGLRVRRAGGVVVDVTLKGMTIRDQAGRLIAFGWLLHDITQVKSADLALRKSQQFTESTLDSLPIHIAILDDTGTIVAVNAAWRRFGAANGYADPDAGVGTSYLHVCDQASGAWAGEAPSVARGLREIIAGQRERFQIEYPCHSPDEKRWFILNLSRFVQDRRAYVVTAHLNITERKQAEEQLRESETRFRMFADSAPVLIWLSDAKKQCTFFNRPWLEFTERTLEQELGFGWAEGVYPEDRQRCLATYEESHASHKSFSMEYRLRRSDGEYRWVLDTGVPRYIADKGFAGYIGSCIDITERKQAEIARLYLAAIVESSHDAIIGKTFDGIIHSWNIGAERVYGYTAAEVLGRSIALLIPPDRPDELPGILESLRQGKSITDYETVRTRKDGTLIQASLTISPIRDSYGTIIGASAIARDITERRQVEEALRKAQERTESILSSMADTHILFDRQWRYLYVNTAAAHAIGRPPDQILGHTLCELYPGIVGTELDRQYHRAMDEHLSVAFDFHYATTDTWWENRFYPTPEGLAVFATNITERKRVEETLRLYAERLEMLHQLDQAILAARSPVKIVQAALSRLRQLVPCQRAGVLMLGSEDRRASALIVDANGEFRVESKLHMLPEIYDSSRMVGADEISQELENTSQPLIYDDPPPIIQALLADGIRSYMILPLISQDLLIGVLSLGAGERHAFTSMHLDIAREVANSVAIAVHQAHLSEQLSDGRAQLRSLARRLVETQETERRQLAQELHDQVGQNLTALNIGLSIVREDLSVQSNTKVRARLEESARLIAETMERIRDVMAALRPAVLDDYGLAAALRWYAQQFSARTGLEVTLRLDEEAAALRLAPEVETALFRATQEALTNVVKHARVEHAAVVFETHAQVLRLTIEDDGVGFDPAEMQPADERYGLGLIGMRERIEAVGGRLELVSVPGKGTRIVAEVWR